MSVITRWTRFIDWLVDLVGLAPSGHGGRIKGFDGVRGIAAVLVLAHHTILTDRHLGLVSVYVFFALSGFLIIKALHETRVRIDFGAGSTTQEFTKFIWRRAVRLAPSYYVSLATVCLFFLVSGRLFGDVYQYRAYYASFTQNMLVAFVTHKWGAFTQTWSLAVEQQAYLVCGLALLAAPARRHGQALATLAVASFAASVALAKSDPGGLAFYCLPFNSLVFMLAGGAFAIYGPKALASADLGDGVRSTMAAALGLAIAVAAFTADGPTIVEWAPGVPNALIDVVLALAAALFLLLVSEGQDSPVVRLLEFRPLVVLGAVSYTFYVVQLPVAHIVSHAFERAPDFVGKKEALFGLDFALTTALSLLSYVFVERPLALFKSPRRAWRIVRHSPAAS
jgi:peptidoglycan/LPS O-acetylase OafA/YrhL